MVGEAKKSAFLIEREKCDERWDRRGTRRRKTEMDDEKMSRNGDDAWVNG